MEAPAVGFYRARLYLVGQRLYQVVVAGPREDIQGQDADRYLNSLKLKKAE